MIYALLELPTGTLLAWLAAALVSLAGLIQAGRVVSKAVWVPVKAHILCVQQIAGIAPALSAMMPKLEKVVKMVLPNSGQSLPDKLDRIEAAVNVLQMQHDTTASLAEFNIITHHRAAFQCNGQGENTLVNPAYCNLLGADSSELLGLGWRSFVHNLPGYDLVWRTALVEGRSCRFDLTFMHARTHEPIYCVCQITALHPGNAARGFLGMLEEVIPERGRYVEPKPKRQTSRVFLRPAKTEPLP